MKHITCGPSIEILNKPTGADIYVIGIAKNDDATWTMRYSSQLHRLQEIKFLQHIIKECTNRLNKLIIRGEDDV